MKSGDDFENMEDLCILDFSSESGTVLRTYIDIPNDVKWIHGKSEFSNE